VSLLDRLLGRNRDRRYAGWSPAPAAGPPPAGRGGQLDDQAAIERYRYLLRAAPPEAIEQAHTEAFAKLTPEQRRQVLAEVGAAVPPAERARSDDPASLARMATRAELRQPGTMERVLGRSGGMGGGIGLGGMIAGGLLASVAGAFVGTAIAEQLFDEAPADPQAAEPEAAADTGDPGAGPGADAGGADFGATSAEATSAASSDPCPIRRGSAGGSGAPAGSSSGSVG